MKKSIYPFLILFLIVVNYSLAQQGKYKALYDTAFTYFEYGNYQHALPVFLKIQSAEPDNANITFHIGVCYTHMPLEKYKSIPYLEEATERVSKDYLYSVNEKNAPVETFFELGKSYLINYDLGKAIQATEQYKTYLDESANKEELKKADHQIAMCKTAKVMVTHPIPTRVENLGSNINTNFPEYAPVIAVHSDSLIFTARRKSNLGGKMEDNGYYFEDLYISTKDENGKWSEARNMGTYINTSDHEASISMAPDKKQLFIYKDDGGDGNIYLSQLKNNYWNKPVKLPSPINSKSWETHATLTPDGNTLYFTSDRKGGYGGLDIYKSHKMPDGSWGPAINLDTVINTEYNEDGPFILYGNILYFCSQGHNTMGGYDIFYSRMKSDSTWSKPVNIGYPINTTDDDLFFTPVDSLTAYFASVRFEDEFGTRGFGDLDIYKLTIFPIVINGIALDNKTNEIIPGAKLLLMNDNKEVIGQTYTDTNGAYSFPADYNMNYILKAQKDNYSEGSDSVSTYNIGDAKEVTVKLFLEKIFSVSLKLKVFDARTNKPLENVNVVLKDVESGSIENLTTNADGEIYKPLDDKKVNDSLLYDMVITKEDYVVKHVEFRYLISKSGQIVINEAIGKIEVGADLAKFAIKPIFFDLDKYNIRPDAAIELDKIVEIMKQYPTIIIELSSHTDCRQTYEYNERLSDNRAKSTAAYIISKGISKNRISGKGYGETRLITDCPCEGPQASNCSEEAHQLNRRTEFVITGFISELGNVNVKSEEITDIYNDLKAKKAHNVSPNVVSNDSIKTGNNVVPVIENLMYRIQIMAGLNNIAINDPYFKGLQNIYLYKHRGLYKYTWGETNQQQEAVELKRQMIEKGFADAFIVPFYNNKRITMEEVEEMLAK